MKTDKEFLESLREKEAVYLRKRAGRRKAAGFAAGGLLLAGIVIGVGAFAGKKPAIPEEGTPKVAELPSASQPATSVKTAEGTKAETVPAGTQTPAPSESDPALPEETRPEETKMIAAATDCSTEDRIESVGGRGFFWSRSSLETSEEVAEKMAPASAAVLRYIDQDQIRDWNNWIARSRDELDRKADSVRSEAEAFMEQVEEGDFFAENVLGICFLKLRLDLPVRLEGTEIRGRDLVMKLEQQAEARTLYDGSPL